MGIMRQFFSVDRYYRFSISALLGGTSYLWHYQQLPLEWESIRSSIL